MTRELECAPLPFTDLQRLLFLHRVRPAGRPSLCLVYLLFILTPAKFAFMLRHEKKGGGGGLHPGEQRDVTPSCCFPVLGSFQCAEVNDLACVSFLQMWAKRRFLGLVKPSSLVYFSDTVGSVIKRLYSSWFSIGLVYKSKSITSVNNGNTCHIRRYKYDVINLLLKIWLISSQ